MRRFAALLTLVIALAFSVIGCGGGTNTSGIPYAMTLTPTTYSLNWGQTIQLSPVVTNYSGNTLNGQNIIYSSSSPTIADVANGSTYPGTICGGTWDSETNPVVCHPATTEGYATITATATDSGNTVSAPPVTVFVHPQVGSIAVWASSEKTNITCPSSGACLCPNGGNASCPSGGTACTCSASVSAVDMAHCISGAPATPETALFTATVCSGAGATPGNCPHGKEITGWIGPLGWSVTPASVGIPDTSGNTCTYTSQPTCFSAQPNQPLCNTCQLTASVPGQAFITASAANVTSAPAATAVITTCPVQSISLTQLAAGSATSSSVATGAAVSLSAVATDSKGNQFSSLPASTQYSSSQPAVAAAASTVVPPNPGNAALVASCVPPSCNAGLYSVYSNPYLLNATGATSTFVYISSKSLTGTYLVPISTSTNTADVVVPVSPTATPNSMLIDPTGANIVLGTDNAGILIYNISAGTTTVAPFNGKVVAASHDGTTMVVYDVNATPTAYIYSLASSSLTTSLPMPGTTAARAAFSPDSGTAYVVGSNGSGSGNILFTWTSSTAPQRLSVANETAQPLNDVDILPQGAFAYLAGGNHNVSVYATCNSQDVTGTPAVTPAGTPTILRAVPNGSLTTADPNNASSILTSGADVLAINSPFIDDLTVTIDNVTGVSSTPGSVCIPPGFTTTRRNPATNPFDFRPLLGGAGFTANQLIVTSNGSNAFILDPGQNVILKYNVPSNTGSTIALANNAHPTSGGVTLDGASLYVGGSDGNVHLINLSTGSDTVISLSSASAPAKFAPDFVAVVP